MKKNLEYGIVQYNEEDNFEAYLECHCLTKGEVYAAEHNEGPNLASKNMSYLAVFFLFFYLFTSCLKIPVIPLLT
jgi:hypothetical protein